MYLFWLIECKCRYIILKSSITRKCQYIYLLPDKGDVSQSHENVSHLVSSSVTLTAALLHSVSCENSDSTNSKQRNVLKYKHLVLQYQEMKCPVLFLVWRLRRMDSQLQAFNRQSFGFYWNLNINHILVIWIAPSLQYYTI